MAILAADKDKEIKTLFLKYMAWNMLPLLYNDALKKLCKMGFSLAKATKLLKSMQAVSYTHLTLPTTPYV